MSRMSVIGMPKGGLALAFALASGVVIAAGLRYDISADHADSLYACGETAVFAVTVTQDDGAPAKCGKVRATLDNFGSARFASAEWTEKKIGIIISNNL